MRQQEGHTVDAACLTFTSLDDSQVKKRNSLCHNLQYITAQCARVSARHVELCSHHSERLASSTHRTPLLQALHIRQRCKKSLVSGRQPMWTGQVERTRRGNTLALATCSATSITLVLGGGALGRRSYLFEQNRKLCLQLTKEPLARDRYTLLRWLSFKQSIHEGSEQLHNLLSTRSIHHIVCLL